MAADEFQKTSVDWELGKAFRQAQEWVNYTFFGPEGNRLGLPNWVPPDWFLQVLFWIILGLLLLWLGWFLYPPVRSLFEAARWADGPRVPQPRAAAQALTPAEWQRRSRQAYHSQNYREACRALYMAALQQLNDRHLIQQQPSRTDGEYLTLLETVPNASAYDVLIRTHERLCFSHAAVSADAYEQCARAYQEIEPT